MDISWNNTRAALKDFANLLCCEQCGNKPIQPMRYSNCGHFVCRECVSTESKCNTCSTPVRPNEIYDDTTVGSLIRNCDIIVETLGDCNLWNNNTTVNKASPTKNVPKEIPGTSKSNIDYIPKQIVKNLNKRNKKGETVLHKACIKGQEEYVKSLLAAGANPNTKDNANWTPLQEVVSMGYYNICKLLLDACASPDVPGIDNKTALHEAVIGNRIEEAKLLLHYNANIHVYDQHGYKPIHYCTSEEMRMLLTEAEDNRNTPQKGVNLNRTLDQSFSTGNIKFVVYPLNLEEKNRKALHDVQVKHKVKVVPKFKSVVTHVIVEAKNIINLTYDILLAMLHGKWIINSDWIALAADLQDIFDIEMNIFEINSTPLFDAPRRARENAEKQNPRLFNNCYFYFALQAKNSYSIGDMEFTKESLMRLVSEGEGNILTREPDPEDTRDKGMLSPFHATHDPHHPLHRCSHYIIYVPGSDEPRIKYKMPHIKSLPLVWLIESIEKFTLIDPSHFGLI